MELPGQQAPRSLIDEPQFKHQEVAGVAHALFSSTNLPTAAAHPER